MNQIIFVVLEHLDLAMEKSLILLKFIFIQNPITIQLVPFLKLKVQVSDWEEILSKIEHTIIKIKYQAQGLIIKVLIRLLVIK